jgi:hypothetical protein
MSRLALVRRDTSLDSPDGRPQLVNWKTEYGESSGFSAGTIWGMVDWDDTTRVPGKSTAETESRRTRTIDNPQLIPAEEALLQAHSDVHRRTTS